jgi:hypothetical protein
MQPAKRGQTGMLTGCPARCAAYGVCSMSWKTWGVLAARLSCASEWASEMCLVLYVVLL